MKEGGGERKNDMHSYIHVSGHYTVVEVMKVFWNQRNLGSNHGSLSCLLCIIYAVYISCFFKLQILHV